MVKQGSRARRSPIALFGVAALVVLLGVFTAGANAQGPSVNASPTLTGLPIEGETLEAHNGSWFGDPPITYTYDWQRCNSGGGDCALIGVPASKTYVVTAADVGSRLRAWVTATNRDCGEINYQNGTQECRMVSVGAPTGQTDVIQPNPNLKPTSTAPPTITGTAEEGQTLKAEDGGWNGPGPITTSRQWERCDAGGAECAAIPGATASEYTVGELDVAHTLRVVVTASNPRGTSAPAASAVTAVVPELKPRPGRSTIAVEQTSLPERLQIDQYVATPKAVRKGRTETVRIRVSDTRGFQIVGALVSVKGVPRGVLGKVKEIKTDEKGWATFKLRPTAKLRYERGSWFSLYVHARKPGEKRGAGISSSALVEIPVVPAR
jgi:hypothetical protein